MYTQTSDCIEIARLLPIEISNWLQYWAIRPLFYAGEPDATFIISVRITVCRSHMQWLMEYPQFQSISHGLMEDALDLVFNGAL